MRSSSCVTTTKSAHESVRQVHERYQSIQDKTSDEAFECTEALAAWGKRHAQFGDFLASRGRRYAECTFDNFEVQSEPQQKVVDALRNYALSGSDQNVLLIGTVGSGKDHLLVALAKKCFMQSCIIPHWMNGVDLHEQFHRESMNGSPFRLIDPLEKSDVLYLSDPIPPTGSLSEAKQSAMFRLIDYRYSQCKPTWMSLNVLNGAEAEMRMGSQTVDRLRDNAVVLFCNWASHRKVAK